MTPDRLREIRALLDDEEQYHGDGFGVNNPPRSCTSCAGEPWPCQVMQIVTATRELLEFAERETEPFILRALRERIANDEAAQSQRPDR